MDEQYPAWYAARTRSRHEKKVAASLSGQRLHTYLPLRRTWSSRRDRKITIEVPALPGYLFIHCTLSPQTRALIKRSAGVLYLVESAGRPAAIPERQIHSLHAALAHANDVEHHPYPRLGGRVRVTRGPMEGVEGYLVRIHQSRPRLMIAVDYVNQALSIEIDADYLEAVD
ncbi:MAG: UpxY family transcription antiterminator [Armatimonadetes bacterium]|nr:UpxY family transcription antiterminator [Armatimonadota bacterium]